jgi:cytochrome c biogenesis protein CcdA
LNEYRKNKTGCEVTSDEKRQKVFNKIKNIINKNNLAISILGVILLATSINFVELLCSAGLPTIYTQLLASNNLTKASYYGYLLLYVLFFMIDDLIVFFIAITTLETVGISAKYTHTVQLIGGILMLILGILMLFKPEILLFN